MEIFLSGYCRSLDSARTILVDTEDGCVDCAYPDCPHCAACPIAEEIEKLLQS